MQSYFPRVYNTDGEFSLRLTIHRAVFFVLLFLLVAAQPVSNFMMSGMEILLAVNWLLEWDMRRKWANAKKSGTLPMLVAFLVLMGVHLLWLLSTSNMDYGWNDIFKKLPLVAIPLVLLTSLPPTRKQLEFIFLGFVTSVAVASVVGLIRYFTITDLPYRQIVPFISHIRFSLNVCLAIIIVVLFLAKRATGKPQWADPLWWTCVALLILFLTILLKIRSFTALVLLFVTSALMIAIFWRRMPSALFRKAVLSAFLLLTVAIVSLSAVMVHQYYSPVCLMQKPLPAYTLNGNPYTHNPDGIVENGNVVDNYVCEVELRRHWPEVSNTDIDAITPNGYAVYPTLIRYLNGLGTTKDSVGIMMLSPEDVDAIERGVANPVYLRGSSIRQMYYVMLFEYENYRRWGCVKDFTMLERLELWHNAWRVFLKHPLLGVGTGDVFDACRAQLIADESPINDTKKHPHNQYLSFLVAFGLTGFVAIVVAFVWALRRGKMLQMPAAAAYFIIVLISFLSEDTLETLAGCVFATLSCCLFQHYRLQCWKPMGLGLERGEELSKKLGS